MTPGAPAEPVVRNQSPKQGIGEFAMDACNLYWRDLDATGWARVMAISK